ncbi:exo-poly-alpha-D-galacturonosidase [Nibricoccus aquaticus]|uniref:Exo-poly-alpha-D-galacturonosidase n=1 Tax=Nibricoccus aquaticus TaxID=2576891 RepID=A0A290QH10_9BACT|nr:glycoside hydrolase family 28 protein [Nibricoccus aquaticus]ATC63641.1 exo-poly-alpha-D-galacturonosidase [Nibricoccus aquaticus]
MARALILSALLATTSLTAAEPAVSTQTVAAPLHYDIRAFGATGDGQALDTDAINRAIEAAHAAGGGTVYFPAGTYLSFSIRLKSNLTLHLGAGATLRAAKPEKHGEKYDAAEPTEWGTYQDFGHSHWRNSLIWGENLENISITGPGRIDGTDALTRRGPGPRGSTPGAVGDLPEAMRAARAANPPVDSAPPPRFSMEGQGNKAIALKLCRNVTLRDFSMLACGHFALLATGVDNLAIDNLRVDTNRDGFDIDACRNVCVSNCFVNSPNDDAICLKSSYGLGFARACENITITNCQVSGYDLGTFLDGTFKRTMQQAPDRDGPTGRIKFGTESNGGFKNITISNCVFDRSRGLAIETVDGGVIEDVTVTNITMRDVTTAPIFLRLGNRARGPEGTPVGAIRRVTISNLTASGVDPRYASIIAGIAGHPIKDVTLSNIRIVYRGGGTAEDAAIEPPEKDAAYPEPSMFGKIPAYGIFVRHAKNLKVRNVEVSFEQPEARPAVVMHSVKGARFDLFSAQRVDGVPVFSLRDVSDFEVRGSEGVADLKRTNVVSEKF